MLQARQLAFIRCKQHMGIGEGRKKEKRRGEQDRTEQSLEETKSGYHIDNQINI